MSGAAQQQQQPGSASGGDGPNRNATRPTNRRAIDDFVDFVEDTKKKCVGRNGLREREPYIPLDALEEYWHPTSIRALCRSLHLSIPCEVDAIKSRLLRTFSLLVHVDMVSHLDVFVKWKISDAHFPLGEDSLPPVLKQPRYKDLVEVILIYQWLFFPLVLKPTELSGIHLPERLILPFDSEETIYQSNSSNITKTVTRSSSSPEIQREVYVIKSYSSSLANRYANERLALTAIQDLRNPHIISYHGSFVQSGTNNLVLGYVDGGNLAEYFENTPRPATRHDAWLFWKSMTGVWKGLVGLHRLAPSGDAKNEASEIHWGVHEDLKPDNILISRNGVTSNSPYEFIPIISDFGHSCVRIASRDGVDPEKRLVPDRHGNQEFAAPEASHHASHLRRGHSTIDASVDVWSMGCILSVAAAWVVMGDYGIESYDAMRSKEFKSIASFEDQAYRGCFHNGTDPLDAVAKTHRQVSETGDEFTQQVVNLVGRFCIVGDPKARQPAHKMYELLCNSLGREYPPTPRITTPLKVRTPDFSHTHRRGISQESGVSSRSDNYMLLGSPISSGPFSPNLQTPPSAGTSVVPVSNGHIVESPTDFMGRSSQILLPSSPSLLEPRHSGQSLAVPETRLRSTEPSPQRDAFLTIDECHEWVDAKKSKRYVDNTVDRAIQRLQKQLKGREHIFLIEDSPSMRSYRKELLDVFLTLSYMAKPMDPNRIELIFASQPSIVHKPFPLPSVLDSLKNRPLREAFKNCQFDLVDGFMEQSLGQVVDKIIREKLVLRPNGSLAPPVSLFVFTDGRWGKNGDLPCGVEMPIQKLMNSTRRYGGGRTQMMVQFVRFGDDENGMQYLDYLDKFGKKDKWDIVDHKPISGNIFTLFTGSITTRGDDEGESGSSSRQT
ncbi:kinase domain-containing protein [Pochonia chlamydosporia 170]|uniref:non-specific serine/threonine protein kinase n=1 Tax=Pochonia chlamydosporia 170 TaxID=1380566 RepID=A0A179FCB9_METCM|nr:kinase domain-containing protein [Pochonia chlamydosporia 170]OAQ62921.1 kinase domain-containing protein [Pochonia chlamydosporia 170]